MRHHPFRRDLTHEALIDWYRSARDRTRMIFDLLRPEAYYDQPIPLRHPFVFYEGHLPAFSVNTLVKIAMGKAGIDPRLETLFARGIDPEDEAAGGAEAAWPSRDRVQSYAAACDELIERTIAASPLDDDVAHLVGDAILTIIEHELMHHETLAYMLHALPYDRKRQPEGNAAAPSSDLSRLPATTRIPAGRVTLGADDCAFGWDNEFPALTVDVADFEIDTRNVTNGDYLGYVEATDAPPPHFWVRRDGQWYWRGMFELLPLPLDAPVYVTHDEAAAYARWIGKRLPTEAEYHRAAYGTPSGEERPQPWGDEPPDATRGNFDFASWEPVPAGAYPEGASAWGVHDLVGNGWEWTSSVFEGFPGFQPMPLYPAYSSDFFDGVHYVLKGASPVTARELVRRSFRNWFRPSYPYVFATFRCVR